MQRRIETWEKDTGQKMSIAKRRALMAGAFVIDAGLQSVALGKIASLVKKASTKEVGALADAIIKKDIPKTHTLLKAMGIEAGQEVTEDLSKDIVAANSFEGPGKTFGRSFDEIYQRALERYGASAAGGALGGSIFYGVGRFGAEMRKPAPLVTKEQEGEQVSYKLDQSLFDFLQKEGAEIAEPPPTDVTKQALRGEIIRLDVGLGKHIVEKAPTREEAWHNPTMAVEAVIDDIRIKPFEQVLSVIAAQSEKGKVPDEAKQQIVGKLKGALGDVFNTKNERLLNALTNAFLERSPARDIKNLFVEQAKPIAPPPKAGKFELPSVKTLFTLAKSIIAERGSADSTSLAQALIQEANIEIGKLPGGRAYEVREELIKMSKSFLTTLEEQGLLETRPDMTGKYWLVGEKPPAVVEEKAAVAEIAEPFVKKQEPAVSIPEGVLPEKEKKVEASPDEARARILTTLRNAIKRQEAVSEEQVSTVAEPVADIETAAQESAIQRMLLAGWTLAEAQSYMDKLRRENRDTGGALIRAVNFMVGLGKLKQRREDELGFAKHIRRAENQPLSPKTQQRIAKQRLVDAGWTADIARAHVERLAKQGRGEGDALELAVQLFERIARNKRYAMSKIDIVGEQVELEAVKPRPKIKKKKKTATELEGQEFDMAAFDRENPIIEQSVTEDMIDSGDIFEEDVEQFLSLEQMQEEEERQNRSEEDEEEDNMWTRYSTQPTETSKLRPGQKSGLTVDHIRSFLNSVSKALIDKFNVQIVQSLSDLPARWRDNSRLKAYIERGDTIEGFVSPDGKEIYLIADGLTGRNRTLQVLLHEIVGHIGLRAALSSKEYDSVIAGLLKSDKGPAIRVLAAVLRTSHERAAEEWFARQVETGKVDRSLWTRIAAAIRRGLRAIGFDMELTDTDIRDLIRRSHDAAQQLSERRLWDAGFSSLEPSPWYHSAMLEAFTRALPQKATVATYRAMIGDFVKSGPKKSALFKKDELEWSGLMEDTSSPLALFTGSFTYDIADMYEKPEARPSNTSFLNS